MLSSREARLIRGLRRRKIREQEGLFLAEGVRVVEDLLASGLPLKVGVVSPALEDTPRGTKLARDLEAACPVRRVPDRTLEELAATETPQGPAKSCPPSPIRAMSRRPGAPNGVWHSMQCPTGPARYPP